MGKSMIEMMEIQEQIQKLINSGYGQLIDIILSNESKVYTKKGRLNKSGACRLLGWKPKELEEALKECKILLEGIEEDE